MIDPALVLGPYGVVVVFGIAINHLYRENTALRAQSMDLLKKYQDRDEEDRRLRQEEERIRIEEERWRLANGTKRGRSEGPP